MVQKAIKEVADDAYGVGPILVCGRSAPVEEVRAALLGTRESRTSAVESYAIRRLRPDDREQLERASVVVYGGEVTHTLDDDTTADLAVIGRVERPLLVRGGKFQQIPAPREQSNRCATSRQLDC